MITEKDGHKVAPLILLLIAFLFSPCSVFGREEQGTKALAVADYERWRRIISSAISDDGNWIVFAYQKLKTDDILFLKSLSDSRTVEVPCGSSPEFSDDSKWLACLIRPSYEEIDKLRKENKAVPQKVQLMKLATGEIFLWENAASFSFSPGSGFFTVKKIPAGSEAPAGAANLIVRNLSEGSDELIGSVGEFCFNKQGTGLAYTVHAADQNGNGLCLINLKTSVHRSLDNGPVHYARPAWNIQGTAVAVLKGQTREGWKERDNVLLIFTRCLDGRPESIQFQPTDDPAFPSGLVITEKISPASGQVGRDRRRESDNLIWAPDGSRIFFLIKEQQEVPRVVSEAADIDVWHAKDKRIQSVQIAQAEADRNAGYLAVFHLKDRRFKRLADENVRRISVSENGLWGIGEDTRDYMSDWKERIADYYLVNTTTGQRTLILKAQGLTFGLSPDSKNFLFWKDKDFWIYKIESGETLNLTERAPVSFLDQSDDHPGEKPPYGVAGWTKDGDSVILNHKHDLWLQSLDGDRPTCLTAGLGEKEEIRFRYVRLDSEGKTIDLSRPAILAAYGSWTKKEGFYELSKGRLKKLVYADEHFDGLLKAKASDRMMYTRETFAKFPDYYVSDSSFSNPRRVTDANPWLFEYKWGSRFIFEFRNKDGRRLQGTLAVPEDRQPDQRLPMIVNFYEKKSQDFHRFPLPMYSNPPQYSLGYPAGNIGPVAEFGAYVSNGYLVMQPDIYFNTRTTHDDMLDCVEAATRKVIDLGYADEARIALGGGSFSGAGSAFIAARSKLFVCVVARAATINLESDFNQLWGWSPDRQKGHGANGHEYYLRGQLRLGTNPYDDPELFRSQTALSYARSMDVPLLLVHGTADDTVAWSESVELYNALRFLGKNVVFLSYQGEGHNLQKYKNQKDLCLRLRQFFDGHLKGKPLPGWWIDGVPFLKRGFRNEEESIKQSLNQ